MTKVNNSIDNSEKCPLLTKDGKGVNEDDDAAIVEVNVPNIQNTNKNGNKDAQEKYCNGLENGFAKSNTSLIMKGPSSSSTMSAAAAAPAAVTFAGGSIKDLNKNILDAQKTIQWQKNQFRALRNRLWSWSVIKRKMLLALLGFALVIIYVNSSTLRRDSDKRIPVLHYSHVPGMKEETEVLQTSQLALTSNANLQNSNLTITVTKFIKTKKPMFRKKSEKKSRKLSMPNKIASINEIQDTNLPREFSHKSAETIKVNAADNLASNEAKSVLEATTNSSILLLNPKKNNVNITTDTEHNARPPTKLIPKSDVTTSAIANAADTFASSAYASNVNVPVLETVTPVAVSHTNFSLQPSASVIETTQIPLGYLVWSERCKMPNIDPYTQDVMEFFERQKYSPCSLLEPLTQVEFDEEKRLYVLKIIKDRIGMFSKSADVDCCYQSIERNGTGKVADCEVWHSKCISFRNEAELAPTIDNILVKCHAKGKQVYINGHAMMPERKEIRERLNTWKSKDAKNQQNATSVLMIGIDSISRINLIRAMPKTAQYLYDNEWFEMSGYNKIDDNTFPNLMAVLIGRNKTHAFKSCPPTEIKGLDNCPFIWNTFREHGYVTAYAEDEASINTFNYLKLGFQHPPVDYYLRPFLLSAEKHLTVKLKSSLTQCIGYQHSADYVYNYALELATRYKNDPYFGLFWMNTFSHNAISDCSAMDVHVVGYLKKLAALETLNNTIVIFFSDHGIRFGPTRKTLSGHLEERLPFMFIWLPTQLKQSHPEFVNALSVNKNRLTNPYDLHMTLKHVLAMSERVKDPKRLAPAEDCPRCQTLLAPVPHNRSCDDIAIEDHWCTCIPYQSVYKNSKNVHKMAQFTVDYINDFVSTFHNGSFAKICQPLHLGNIDAAYRAQHTDNKSEDIYRINFYTLPNKGLFEVTIRHNNVKGDMQITGEISRLNAYVKDSHCVQDGAAKKYCSCRKKQW